MKKKIIIYLILLSSINILLLSSCSNHQPHTHKFNEEKIIKEASCTIDGIKEYKCSCDQTKEEKIPKTGHIESNWLIIEKATCQQEGQKEKKCTICNEILIREVISKVPHDYIEGICNVCKDEDIEYINNLDYSEKLEYQLNEDQKSYSVVGVKGYKYKKLIIPDTYKGLPVTIIGAKAFNKYFNLEIIEMSNNITKIEKSAFSGCLDLIEIIFSENLLEIEDYAFQSCYDLENIIFPKSLIKIGNYAFDTCISLKKVVIPKNVTIIGKYAFGSYQNIRIYCEANSKPDGWNNDWKNGRCTVKWGYTE